MRSKLLFVLTLLALSSSTYVAAQPPTCPDPPELLSAYLANIDAAQFSEPYVAPEAYEDIVPVLTGPENGTSTTDTTPTFSWEAIPDTQEFQLLIGPTNPPTLQLPYSGDDTSATLPTPILYRTYYWRVRGSCSYTGGPPFTQWSETRTITITAPDDAVPQLYVRTAPIGTPVTLTWGGVSWATAYHIQMSRNMDFSGTLNYENDAIAASQQSLTFYPRPLVGAPYGTFYWHVRARTADGGWSPWSTVQAITLETP